jgi:hypothetical protein
MIRPVPLPDLYAIRAEAQAEAQGFSFERIKKTGGLLRLSFVTPCLAMSD